MFVFFLFAFSFPHEHVCGDDPRWHVLNEEILDDHQRVHVCDVLGHFPEMGVAQNWMVYSD